MTDEPPGPEFPVRVAREVYPRPSGAESLMRAPDGAPNVLIVLLDAVGFGVLNTFGGLVESATLDRLARGGLRYCQFHTTGLSSPTRAALITGRNHHAVAAGVDQEVATGYPGYNGVLPGRCATVAELLRQNGYATGWWGKNHNVPDAHAGPAGPFDRWPQGLGFDYFYGFIGAETDQLRPLLFRNTTPVDPPETDDGYHLTTDITNDCIAWIRRQKTIAPDRPIFVYVAPAGGHAPQQPPLARRGRHAGKFDFGWDEYRTRVFERQRALGVAPSHTRLGERPFEIPSWDSASPDERRLFARFFENYADVVEHVDAEMGRIVDALEELSELENTLVLYVVGDGGCSADGSLTGTLNANYVRQGYEERAEDLLPRIDEIGLTGTSTHMPTGWAWAGNTPFPWASPVVSHLGATRNPLVVHWPRRILEGGGQRSQFHHVIDLAPTILEIVGIAQPSMVNGVAQRPMDGVSLAYTFAGGAEGAPGRRSMQYFEAFGHRALYRDGWFACCRLVELSRRNVGAKASFDEDRWELYHLAEDFTQTANLAEREPKTLRELQDLFVGEATRNDVWPLDDRYAERLDVSLRPNWFHGRRRVTLFPGLMRLPEGSAPKTHNVDHAIVAKLRVPRGGAEGVIVCCGGATGGWSFFVYNKRLVYHYNFFGRERYEAVSDRELPAGDIEVEVRLTNETDAFGGPAHVALFVDGEPVGEAKVARQPRARFGFESLDVGRDAGTPVAPVYRSRRGFAFTGVIERVTIELSDVGAVTDAREQTAALARAE